MKPSNKSLRQPSASAKRRFIRPTDAEEAAINRHIAEDPDTIEITNEVMARMRPAAEQLPQIVSDYKRRTRGPQKSPKKVQITLRLDPDVLAELRDSGPGWQSRANELLRAALSARH